MAPSIPSDAVQWYLASQQLRVALYFPKTIPDRYYHSRKGVSVSQQLSSSFIETRQIGDLYYHSIMQFGTLCETEKAHDKAAI